MLYDELGLPKVIGASDLQDSVALAGIMVATGYDTNIDLSKYLLKANTLIELRDEKGSFIHFDKDIYVRHPLEYKYDLSRDQYTCLIAGLAAQGKHDLVDLKYVNGRDIIPYSIQDHTLRCQKKGTSLLSPLWLGLDIAWHALFKFGTSEPTQLICVLSQAPVAYTKLWCFLNRNWERSIRKYWYTEDGAWRQEPELAEHLINYIKQRKAS